MSSAQSQSGPEEGYRVVTPNSQRVLLTGGAGFIGSHVAEALLRRGFQLTVLDNLDSFYSSDWKKANLREIEQIGSFEFREADICEMNVLREIIERQRPEIIIHLAARAGVRPSIEQPQLYERVNVTGTLNLLEMCRAFKVKKFVFGSSSSVYGTTSNVPFSEQHMELRPISPYAASKLAGEMFSYVYSRLFGFTVVCLRFFTVYGPRQRPDLAIHKFTGLIEEGNPIPVYGDGSAGRDYTYVEDIVAGVLSAVEYEPHPAAGPAYEVFNLGNSHPVTLNELVALLERTTGRKATVALKPFPLGDVPITWADISKAERLLHYKPVTPLEEGLKRFVAWYRSVDPGRRASAEPCGANLQTALTA